MIRYLLDENVPPVYRVQLLRRQPELHIQVIGEIGVPAYSTPDPEILGWCEEHSFLLVTNNRESMPEHLADHLAEGRHVPGILIIRPHAAFRRVIEDLLLIAAASDVGEYRDQIIYIPL